MNTVAVFVCCLFALAHCHISTDDGDTHNDIRAYYKKLHAKEMELRSTCNECILVASELKNVLDDPTKINRIKIALKLLCDYVGGERAEECRNIVDNFDFVIHQLEPYLDNPEQFCKEIHLCSTTRLPLSSIIVLKAMEFLNRSAHRENLGDMLCDECVFAATEMNSLLRNQRIQQELKAELESVCQILPSYSQQCNEIVEEFFPKFLQFLQKLMSNPQQFCSELKLCQSVQFSLREFASEPILPQPTNSRKLFLLGTSAQLLKTQNGNNVVCVMCISSLDAFKVEINKNRDAISRRLGGRICHVMPNELRSDCIDFSNIYASSILNMTLNQVETERTCKSLGLCTQNAIASFDALSEPFKADTICEACHVLSDFLSFELRQPSLQHEITNDVKTYFCTRLPGDLADECLDTADEYVPSVMMRLADQFSSASFCLETGLCSS